MDIKFPDVQVQLTGEDGNAFFIIGRVSRELKRAGHSDGAAEYRDAAMSCGSYDELLALTMETVDVL
jgi:hypothetical protein